MLLQPNVSSDDNNSKHIRSVNTHSNEVNLSLEKDSKKQSTE